MLLIEAIPEARNAFPILYHTEKLEEAEPAITQVRNNLYAHA